VWRIGLLRRKNWITRHAGFCGGDVPQSYASVIFIYSKKDRIRTLNDVSSSDAKKFAISGGAAEIGRIAQASRDNLKLSDV
jgi:hypothetical protein